MKRTRLIAVAVVLALGALWWALSGDEGDGSTASDDATTHTARSDGSEKNRKEPEVSAFAAKGARVAGVVLQDGRPVSRAKVSLRSTAPLMTLTLDDGRFLFDDVPSGSVYVAASSEGAASEVLGPLQLVPGGRIDDLQLILLPAVKIEGRVVDLLTQKPIVGAAIIAPTQLSKTDENGRFHLSGAKTQTWLEVTAPGYVTRTEWVSLELASAGGRLELVLTPSSYVEGTVLESGIPVGAATVWAEYSEGPRRGERGINVFTDREGKFALECGAGTFQISAVTPRGTRVKGPMVRLSVGEKKSGLVLDAGEVTSAEGIVRRAGEPVGAAQLSAIDAQTEELAAMTTSMPDGRFRFDGLALGRYVLQVRAGSLTASAGPFDHRGDGQTWTVDLKTGGTLTGRVEPVTAGVAVRWRSGTWSGPSAQTVTDAAGKFRFEGLPEEPVSVDAEGPAGAATARARAGDEVVMVLKKGFVTVHLRDDQGAPVTDGVLGSKSLETGATRRQLVLAPDGAARIDLPLGRWQLSLEVSGRGRSASTEITVDEKGADVTLTLESSVSVTGRVTSRATQLPIVGARIEALSGEVGRISRVSVLTDARGEFLLPPVSRSSSVAIVKDGFHTQWRRVEQGSRLEVALEVDPATAQKPGPELSQFEGVGMTLNLQNNLVMVMVVSEGSPAERAGVQAGDQILAVDSVAVAGQSLDAIVQRIRGPAGTPVSIRFQRAGQVYELGMRRKLLTL